MTPLSVLVTAVGGGGIGEQLIKALRLAPRPYRIVGTDMSSFSKGFCEVDEAEVVPAAHDPGFLPALLRLSERHEVRAILCGSEAELEVLSAHRQMIEAAGIFLPINPDHVLEICLDKVKTSAFLSANGFATPAYAKISSSAQLAEFHHLPAVIKPSHGSGGSTNVFLAQSIPDLVGFSEHLLAQQLEIVVQEYVGTPENEFTVGVLSGMDGVILNSIAVRRNILTGLSNRLKERNRTTRDDLGPILAISRSMMSCQEA